MIVSIAISAFINTIPNILCGEELFENIPNNKKKKILLMLMTSILATINYLFFDNVLKMVTMYLIIVLFYKLLFNNHLTKTLIAAFFMYIINSIAELIYIFCLIIINLFFGIEDIGKYAGTIFSNIIIAILTLFILKLTYKKIKKGMKVTSDKSKISVFIVIIMIFLTLSSLFYKMAFYEWKYNYEMMLNIILVTSIIIIGIIIIIHWAKYVNMEKEYELLTEYAKASEQLIEEYRIITHENKNQLFIIKGMAKENNKELLEYLGEVSKEKIAKKYEWITTLKNIPYDGLKGLLHFKLIEMEKQKIKVDIYVSSEIKNSILKKLTINQKVDLGQIIGVYIDNAIEASKISLNKNICIDISNNGINNNVIFIIANTYSEKIDMEKLDAPKYSSKGKNRGHGRTLAKRLIMLHECFEEFHKVDEEYFYEYFILKSNINNR